MTLTVIDGRTNYYQVTAVDTSAAQSSPSAILAAVANPFTNMDQFLDYVQETDFDYFWYWANPLNGLVPGPERTQFTREYCGCWIRTDGDRNRNRSRVDYAGTRDSKGQDDIEHVPYRAARTGADGDHRLQRLVLPFFIHDECAAGEFRAFDY